MTKDAADEGRAREPITLPGLASMVVVAVATCALALWAAGAGGGVLSSDGAAFALLVAGIVVPPVAIVAAVTAGARGGAVPYARALGALTGVLLAAIVILVLVDETGCGSSPARSPGALDPAEGTYRGVGVGSTAAAARRVLGPPERRTMEDPFAPVGEEGLEVGVPPAPVEPRGRRRVDQLRWRDAVLVTEGGRTVIAAFTADDARDRKGVGVGNDLDAVREAYPSFECGIANEGTEYVQFPYCTGRVATGRHVWFAYDPVRSVTVSRSPLISRAGH